VKGGTWWCRLSHFLGLMNANTLRASLSGPLLVPVILIKIDSQFPNPAVKDYPRIEWVQLNR
jgi:hypothetical protein